MGQTGGGINFTNVYADGIGVIPDDPASLDTDPGGGNSHSTSLDNFVFNFPGMIPPIIRGVIAGGSLSNVTTNFLDVYPYGTLTIDESDGSFTWVRGVDDLYSRPLPIDESVTQIVFTITADWVDSFIELEIDGTPVEFSGGGDPGTPVSGTDTDTITFNFNPCFAAGTGIATPEGERAVEALQVGDLVRTADGRDVPVKWVGRVTANPMFNPADRLEPVLIRVGALGGNTPHTDLIVTADHGMILDNLVINASALVGARGIEWYPWKSLGATLTYYHVETQDHEVILANGAPAETYVDSVARQSFDNYAEYVRLYGDEQPIAEMPWPRIAAARLLPNTIRARLGLNKSQRDRDTQRFA